MRAVNLDNQIVIGKRRYGFPPVASLIVTVLLAASIVIDTNVSMLFIKKGDGGISPPPG